MSFEVLLKVGDELHPALRDVRRVSVELRRRGRSPSPPAGCCPSR